MSFFHRQCFDFVLNRVKAIRVEFVTQPADSITLFSQRSIFSVPNSSLQMAKVTTAYYFLKPLHSLSFFRFTSSLATELASLIEQNSSPAKTINPKLQTRMQLKRFLELRIKKRVKSQLSHHDGKFHNLIQNVVSNPQTLLDAYNIIKINSNILTVSAEDNGDGYFLNDVAQRLNEGSFDVNANTHSISTRKKKKNRRGFDEKEEEELLMLDLVLPNLKLRVVQEALRIVLEVIFKPNFSKISHGCRSGRGCVAALKYICKGVVSPDWWFTLLVEKKIDRLLMEKLVCVMEDKIEDGCLFGLIRSMFDARVLNFEFGGFPKGDGLPQEGILSPTLMNIYLDLFDSEFHRLLMKYEGVCGGGEVVDGDKPSSALRSWFRRQLAGSSNGGVGGVESSGVKVYCL
ncbi:RNA binding protein, partial [Trifolium pratense]